MTTYRESERERDEFAINVPFSSALYEMIKCHRMSGLEMSEREKEGERERGKDGGLQPQ